MTASSLGVAGDGSWISASLPRGPAANGSARVPGAVAAGAPLPGCGSLELLFCAGDWWLVWSTAALILILRAALLGATWCCLVAGGRGLDWTGANCALLGAIGAQPVVAVALAASSGPG